MMRVMLVVVALLAAIAAADLSFTGTTSGQFFYPSSLSDCSPSSSFYTYGLVNVTFSTPGVRKVDVLAQSNNQYVYLYEGGFNPNNTCNYSISFPDNDLYISGSEFNDGSSIGASTGLYFASNINYYIVVATSSASVFGVNIIDSNSTIFLSGNLSEVGTKPWNNPYYQDDDAELAFTSTNTSYGTYVFSVATGAYYDITIYTYNQTRTAYSSIGFYDGDVSNLTIYGNYSAIFASRDRSSGGKVIYRQYLNAGATFTIVAAVYNDDVDSFVGFFVRPTSIVVLADGSTITGVYTQPTRQSYSPSNTCTESSNKNAGYVVTTFTAGSQVTLVSFSESIINRYSNNIITGIDFTGFFYSYSNTFPRACPATALEGRYLSGIDSGVSYQNIASAGDTQTFILSPYFGTSSFSVTTGAVVKIFNGVGVAAAPTTPTTAPTSSPTPAPTTLPITTGTAAPTSTPSSAPTASPTTGTAAPTSTPSRAPTAAPTTGTAAPTSTPSRAPTAAPTTGTAAPTAAPASTTTGNGTVSTSGPTPTTAPATTTSGAAQVVAFSALMVVIIALLL